MHFENKVLVAHKASQVNVALRSAVLGGIGQQIRRVLAPGDDTRSGVAALRRAPAGGARLLLADDNTDAANTLADLLRVLGCEVRCASDSNSAIALLESYLPDLAVLDIGLPGEDGYSLARRLRADGRLAGTRLVALTGYGQEKDRQQAMDAHFDEHLVKPVSVERLMNTRDRLLGATA